MPASVSLGYAILMDGGTYSGLMFRQMDGAGLAFNQGASGAVAVRPGIYQGATRWRVQAGSGMTVTVDGGCAVVPSQVSAVNGAYRVASMVQNTLTVATSDPTNPRIDMVAIAISDVGTSSSTVVVEVLTGTPTAGATLVNLNGAPSGPVSSLILAYVLVPAGSSSVTGGNISDQRTYTVAPGGILPLASTASPPNGQAGQFAYDTVNDRLFELSAAGPVQARTLPWAPQFAQASGGSFTGSIITVCSVSVTVDGSTDLEMHASWEGMSAFLTAANAVFSLAIDGTIVKKARVQNSATDSSVHAGGAMCHYTASGVDRPTAGSHTIALGYTDNVGSGIHPSGPVNSELYVRACPL